MCVCGVCVWCGVCVCVCVCVCVWWGGMCVCVWCVSVWGGRTVYVWSGVCVRVWTGWGGNRVEWEVSCSIRSRETEKSEYSTPNTPIRLQDPRQETRSQTGHGIPDRPRDPRPATGSQTTSWISTALTLHTLPTALINSSTVMVPPLSASRAVNAGRRVSGEAKLFTSYCTTNQHCRCEWKV